MINNKSKKQNTIIRQFYCFNFTVWRKNKLKKVDTQQQLTYPRIRPKYVHGGIKNFFIPPWYVAAHGFMKCGSVTLNYGIIFSWNTDFFILPKKDQRATILHFQPF